MRRFAIFPCWLRCLVTIGLFIVAGSAQGQGPPTGLRTNEVLIRINLFILHLSSPKAERNESGEQVAYAMDGDLRIDGVFAAQLKAPELGKRSITLFRRLPEGLTGSFEDHLNSARLGIGGEGGGDRTYRDVQKEEWWFPSIDVTPTGLDLVIDLNTSTWTSPEFASAVDRMVHETTAYFNYSATRTAPNVSYVEQTWVSGDPDKPPPDMRGGSPQGNKFAADSLFWAFEAMDQPQPLESSDALYSGSFRRVVGTREDFQAAFTFTWSIEASLPELELRVTSPNLEQWRPQADPAGTVGDTRPNPGKRLKIMAEVVSPSGEKPVVRIRKMRWWLEDTSRLPGYAMNAPYPSEETSPDLEIDHPEAKAEGQELTLTTLTTLRSEIRIKPYDWGGWSTLRVEAELDDGRKLSGKLKGQTGDETAIRLPAREPDSKVANSWKRRINAVGLADDEDDDSFPKGRRNGDGFTLFEEYRGFYASELGADGSARQPAHHSTNPKGKTVFVYDRIDNTHTTAARSLFEAASEARVYVITPGYGLLDESRIMNRNVGQAPTKGAQHAIGITLGSEWAPILPATPGLVQVKIVSFAKAQRTFSSIHPAPILELYRRSIATRLLMACRVDRPGIGDKTMRFIFSRDANGLPMVTEGGKRVTLLDEASKSDLAEGLLTGWEAEARIIANRSGEDVQSEFWLDLWAGKRGGQHSGPLDNIMRMAIAEAYIVDGTTVVVLSVPPAQKLGSALTETSVGDEYNAPGPNTRFGSSPNPPSRTQFDVKDQAP